MMYYDLLNGTEIRYFMLMKYAKLQRFLSQISLIWLFSETICQGSQVRGKGEIDWLK